MMSYENKKLIHTDRLEYPVTQQVSRRDREIIRPFAIRSGRLVKVLMPRFRCNGGSVPRFAWWFQSPWTGCGVPGFWGHDADYRSKKGAKLKRDKELLQIHKRYGVARWRRWIIFLILIVFGWFAWWRSPEDGQHVLYFDIAETGAIKLAIDRGHIMAQILEQQRNAVDEHKRELLNDRITSIERGDIDEYLKHKGH